MIKYHVVCIIWRKWWIHFPRKYKSFHLVQAYELYTFEASLKWCYMTMPTLLQKNLVSWSLSTYFQYMYKDMKLLTFILSIPYRFYIPRIYIVIPKSFILETLSESCWKKKALHSQNVISFDKVCLIQTRLGISLCSQ